MRAQSNGDRPGWSMTFLLGLFGLAASVGGGARPPEGGARPPAGGPRLGAGPRAIWGELTAGN